MGNRVPVRRVVSEISPVISRDRMPHALLNLSLSERSLHNTFASYPDRTFLHLSCPRIFFTSPCPRREPALSFAEGSSRFLSRRERFNAAHHRNFHDVELFCVILSEAKKPRSFPR